jgi:hypothetical protein
LTDSLAGDANSSAPPNRAMENLRLLTATQQSLAWAERTNMVTHFQSRGTAGSQADRIGPGWFGLQHNILQPYRACQMSFDPR